MDMEDESHTTLTDMLFPIFLKSPNNVGAKIRELWDVLERTVRDIRQPVYWIIDGIDECVGNGHRLIPMLMKISHNTSALRIIIIGQPDDEIHKLLADQAVAIYITAEMVEEDIQTMIAAEAKSSPVLGNPDIKSEIISTLRDGSESMFLWTRLMLDDLKLSTSKSDARRRLQHLPRGLSNAYGRILERLIASSDLEQLKLSQVIFSFLAVAYRPLTINLIRVQVI